MKVKEKPVTLFCCTCECAAAPMVMHVQYIVTCSFIFFIKSYFSKCSY